MTELQRMAHRVLMGSFAGPIVPDWMLARLEAGLGSVALFGSNVAGDGGELAALTATLRSAGPDVLVATDEEAGDVTRLHAAAGSPWPGNAALGAVDDVRLTELVAAGVGAQLASAGVDLDLAPVVDVNSNPDNPVIGVRSFGSAPGLVARHAAAFIGGLQAAGVGACAKHFPGHGDTAVDSHLGLPTVDASVEVLRGRELVPFVAAVAAGSVAVMTSHVVVPALEAALPAVDAHPPLRAALPATLSRRVLDLLRDDLGFDGLVVSDALDMAGASAGRGVPAAAVAALDAGCDLLCLGADGSAAEVDAVVAALVEAVEAGELAGQRLESAAGRVLAARQRIDGLREVASARGGGPSTSAEVVLAGLAAGREVARRAVVVEADAPLPDLRGVPVLRFRTGVNVAVGQVPWGLPLDGSVHGGRQPVDADATSDLEEVVRSTIGPAGDEGSDAGDSRRGRPVVALVREAHRHPWVLDALGTLAAACPDVVTVEMGSPGGERLPGRATVRTYGASRANGEALDVALTGTPPDAAFMGTPPDAAFMGTPPDAAFMGTPPDAALMGTPPDAAPTRGSLKSDVGGTSTGGGA